MKNKEYMIGERVIFKCRIGINIFEVICTVCIPEEETNYGIWIDNPAKGYKQNVSSRNVRPYEIDHHNYHEIVKRIEISDCDLSKDLKELINDFQN